MIIPQHELAAYLDEIVKVEFLDHTEGEDVDKVPTCTVYGVLEKVTGSYLRIQPWVTGDSDLNGDDTRFCIVMGAVLSVTHLVPAKRSDADPNKKNIVEMR